MHSVDKRDFSTQSKYLGIFKHFLFSFFISVTVGLLFVLKSIFSYFAMKFPNTLLLTVCFQLINFIFRIVPLFATMYKILRLSGIFVMDIATIAV